MSDEPMTGDVREEPNTPESETPKKKRAKKRSRKPGKELVPQKHGGAIHTGNPRPSNPTASDVRNDCRKKFFQVVPRAARIARNEKPKSAKRAEKWKAHKVADQLRAMELLAKYGMADTVSVSDVRAAVAGTLEVIDSRLPPEMAIAIRQAIAPLWLKVWAA